MSFIIGPLSGALVAGGVYYGFSNLIQTRTEKHSKELEHITSRLLKSPTAIPNVPIPAAERIKPHPFTSELKSQWNHEIAKLFVGFQQLDKSVVEWGTSLLHGPQSQPQTEVKKTPEA